MSIFQSMISCFRCGSNWLWPTPETILGLCTGLPLDARWAPVMCFVFIWIPNPEFLCWLWIHQFLQYFILKQQWILISKTYSEWEHPFYHIRCPCKEEEQAETLISILPTQARCSELYAIMRASGPVCTKHQFGYMYC